MTEIDLLNQVNEFYNSAWEKLLIVGTVGLTIVGIIVPLGIQWYQKKSMVLSEARLRDSFEKRIHDFKSEIHEKFTLELQNISSEFDRKIKIAQSNSEAGLYYLQGSSELTANEYYYAFRSFCIATTHSVIAENYSHLQLTLESLSETLRYLKRNDIVNLKNLESIDVEKILSHVIQKDTQGVFRNLVSEIKTSIQNLH